MMRKFQASICMMILLASVLMAPSQLNAAVDETGVDATVPDQVEQSAATTQQPGPEGINETVSGGNTGNDAAGSNPGSNPMSSSYLLQLTSGLIVVLICIVVLAWFAKRVNRLQSSTDGALKILGGLSMGSRERVVLLQVGSKQLLIGVAPGRINTLHVLDGEIDKNRSTTAEPETKFSEKLKGMLSDATVSSITKGKKHND